MNLRELLDNSAPSFRPADLPESDWLILAGLAFAVYFGPDSSVVTLHPPAMIRLADTLGRPMGEANLERSTAANSERRALDFTDSEWCIVSAARNQETVRVKAGTLIGALSLAHNRIDSALLLPPDMRHSRIAALAEQAGVTRDLFHRIALSLPWLERELSIR